MNRLLAGLSVVLLVLGGVAALAVVGADWRFVPRVVAWAYPVASWGGAIALSLLALSLRARGLARLTTSALLVQSLGIFSLLLGLAIGVLPILRQSFGSRSASADVVGAVAWPLVEGLIAAGLSTLLATLLRVSEEVFRPLAAAGAGSTFTIPPTSYPGLGSEIAAEVTRLKSELKRASAEAKELNGQLEATNRLIGNVGVLLEHFDRFFGSTGASDRAS